MSGQAALFLVSMPAASNSYSITFNPASLVWDHERWIQESSDAESWTERARESEAWVAVSADNETWTERGQDGENWTDAGSFSESWTEIPVDTGIDYH